LLLLALRTNLLLCLLLQKTRANVKRKRKIHFHICLRRITNYFLAIIGDDLITPVYVPPTRPPPTKIPPGSGRGPGGRPSKPCDDEDCFEGSGFGETSTAEDGLISSSRGRLHQFCIELSANSIYRALLIL
jgi:hypothetical protein